MGRGLHQASKAIINAAIEILAEKAPITVRGVCYALFVRGLIANMSKGETDRVSRLLTAARERGEIEWTDIVDETRRPERVAQWDNPEQILDAAVRGYRRDAWQDQPVIVEVVSEKGTVRGTLAPVLDRYGVTLNVFHGFASATAINDLAQSIALRERPTFLLYVGDHDPSGMCMSEVDLPERLARYGAINARELDEPDGEGMFVLDRVALTRTQIADHQLPGFNAGTKTGDSRYDWYVRHYGYACHELDALDPNDLRAAVEAAILDHLDADAWANAERINELEKDSLFAFRRSWAKQHGKPDDPLRDSLF
jgi:hypothetical protein